MNWNACCRDESFGAIKTAIIKATVLTIRPVKTKLDSEASFLNSCLYISIEKIVAVLLAIELKDETIAAIRAANARPLRPAGTKLFSNQG